ncbi:MAG TPA: CoA-transferase [Syntrophomonas sp.]|nr:CoA-transferase [Syntrophomonas sp.]
MKKIIKSDEIHNYIRDGDTVFLTGMTLGGFAEEAIIEIERSFLEKGSPRDLTLYFQSGVGNRRDRGMAHIAHEGLLKRVVGGHLMGCGPEMVKLSQENRIEVFNFPQGVMSAMCRHIASGKPGVITKIGLKTMMDPRNGGGKMNQRAESEDLVELINIHDEEWLLYRIPKIDVTLIRGTVADEKGNVSVYKEGYQVGQLAAAQAAKACGGIVICQVENIVEAGTIKPKEVKIPGILIDYVYVGKPEYHWQTGKTQYNPVFSGEIRIPLGDIPLEKLSARKVIARRAAMELKTGDIVNLGVGIPEAVSSVAAEEGVDRLFTLTTEAGGIGGIPANALDFGCCWNPEATLEMEDQFDLYDGGILDFGCLGCLQIAPDGSLNASMRDGGAIGVGGFMNVTGGAGKIAFVTTMTGGINKEEGPEFEIQDGRLIILKEGNKKKFVNNIEQITFNGSIAAEENRDILYITERAVFKLTKEGLLLTEIAPGVDLEKDILANMEFKPIISENLKLMPAEIFNETWNGLAKIMDAKRQ